MKLNIPGLIVSCEHEPKWVVSYGQWGTATLDICATCREKNRVLVQERTTERREREAAWERHPVNFELRQRLYLVQDLREPTHEDFE
jgi:hypothetical protein